MLTKTLQINREKIAFWTIFGILTLSIAFYMYCVNVTVHNTVARQNLEQEASRLALKIGNEEFQYITMRNSVTIGLAHSLGFRESAPSQYISRSEEAKVAFLSH